MTLLLLALQVPAGTAEALKTVPDIITAAAQSVLGILALMILALAILGFYLFRNGRAIVKASMFSVMLAGVAAFGAATIRLQREDAVRAQEAAVARQEREAAVRIQDLRLK